MREQRTTRWKTRLVDSRENRWRCGKKKWANPTRPPLSACWNLARESCSGYLTLSLPLSPSPTLPFCSPPSRSRSCRCFKGGGDRESFRGWVQRQRRRRQSGGGRRWIERDRRRTRITKKGTRGNWGDGGDAELHERESVEVHENRARKIEHCSVLEKSDRNSLYRKGK